LLELIATPAAHLAASPLVHLLLMTRHQKKVAVVIILAGLLLLGIGWIVWRMFTRGWRETEDYDTPDLESRPFGLGDSQPPVDRPDDRPVDEAFANLMTPAPPREDETRSAGELYNAALRLVTEMGGVSIPAIQRKLDIDFERAGELVAQMEKDGFLVPGGAAGAKQKVTPEAYAYIERLDET
jgi:hypothetical protein